jgi:L-fuconate dehydratase
VVLGKLNLPALLAFLDGSDAMNQAPDYSAAYALVETDAGDGMVGHGMTFTIGRGIEVCVTTR